MLFKLDDTFFRVGQVYVLHTDFTPNKDKWSCFYTNYLIDSLISFLKRNQSVVVEIGSHTDCRASKKYNDSISYYRSRNLAEYLVFKKIPYAQLIPRGYGEKYRLVDCPCSLCTEEEHAVNRRYEIKIIDIRRK